MKQFSLIALILLLVPLSGCDLLSSFFDSPPVSEPRSPYTPAAPYHVIGDIEVFYKGPIPLTFEPDPTINDAEDAIGAQIRVSDVLVSSEIAEGDIIIVSWVTDAARPEEPCFEWEVGSGISRGSLVEVQSTGNFCTSSIRAFLLN